LTIVAAAKGVNGNYRLYELNTEKTQLDYDKALIEAMNTKAELAAESSRASGENRIQGNISSFYSEILNDIFDIKTKELSVQTNELTVKISDISYNDKENLYDKGLVSENNFKDASLTLKDAKSDRDKAKTDLDIALDSFKKDTSLDWDGADLFVPDCQLLLVNEEKWIEESLSVQISEYSLEMGKYDIQNLSSNSSLYDKKIADISLEQKEIDLEIAKENALSQKDNYEDGLEYTYKQLQTSMERVNLAKDDLEDVQERYTKGLVSDTEVYNQEKQYLSKVSQYNNSLKSYWTTLSSYLLNADSDMEELIRAAVKAQEETKEE
jgi:outer membrane protein TolC